MELAPSGPEELPFSAAELGGPYGEGAPACLLGSNGGPGLWLVGAIPPCLARMARRAEYRGSSCRPRSSIVDIALCKALMLSGG